MPCRECFFKKEQQEDKLLLLYSLSLPLKHRSLAIFKLKRWVGFAHPLEFIFFISQVCIVYICAIHRVEMNARTVIRSVLRNICWRTVITCPKTPATGDASRLSTVNWAHWCFVTKKNQRSCSCSLSNGCLKLAVQSIRQIEKANYICAETTFANLIHGWAGGNSSTADNTVIVTVKVIRASMCRQC